MQALVPLLYFAISILQFLAIMAGLQVWLGIGSFLSAIGALLLAGFPIIGTIIGMFGAMSGWGWSFLEAGLLFFGSFIAVVAVALASGTLDKMRRT